MWLPWLQRVTVSPSAMLVSHGRGNVTEPLKPAVPAAPLCHYTSPDEDSARWWDFPFRPGDIVVSTRSKSGTTWVQMICLLLVFRTPDLPGRLGRLSPWLDWLVEPKEDVFARLAAQTHRRVIKTHTPLDGVPLDAARHLHRGGTPPARHGRLPLPPQRQHRSPPHGRAHRATRDGPPAPARRCTSGCVRVRRLGGRRPRQWLDTLPGAMLHLSDAWARRHEPNVVLVHYDDLVTDLDGSMRRLAGLLGIRRRRGALAGTRAGRHVRVDARRRRAPDADLGVLKDPAAFFRQGTSGDGRSAPERRRDGATTVPGWPAMAPADLLAWLHRDREA